MFTNVIQEMWKRQNVISETSEINLNSDSLFNNASIISNFLPADLDNLF